MYINENCKHRQAHQIEQLLHKAKGNQLHIAPNFRASQ